MVHLYKSLLNTSRFGFKKGVIEDSFDNSISNLGLIFKSILLGEIFRDIIFPLGLPGWIAGIFLSFIVCVGDYAVPTLLGGGLKPVLAQIMLSILKGTYDLSQAATIAIILAMTVIMCGLPLIIYGMLRRKRVSV